MKEQAGIPYNEYINIHRWILRHYGNASQCLFCNVLNAKRYEWALKKGFQYARNIENFIELCGSCHRTYDEVKVRKNKIKVDQYDVNGIFIKTWPSLSEAAKFYNTSASAIANNLSGLSKSSKNFKWQYHEK